MKNHSVACMLLVNNDALLNSNVNAPQEKL